MNKTEKTLIIIVVYGSFLGLVGYISLLFISIGSTSGSAGGVIVGIMFFLTTVFCVRFVFRLWKQEMKAMDEHDEVVRHSTPVKTWSNSTAMLVEVPGKQIKLLFGSLNFCPHLENVNSLMIKCPNCRNTFPRFYYQPEVRINKEMLKTGRLTATDFLRDLIRKNGFPSEIHCTCCGSIDRSIVG